jgi:hypothetical protein
VDVPLCFAIMPITTTPDLVGVHHEDAAHFVHVAEHLLKPAAEQIGFEFISPEVTGSDLIQAEIIRISRKPM